MNAKGNETDIRMLSRLMLRLLPAQVLLSAAGSVNGIVSGVFASNFIGTDAMSAVGIYAPLNLLITSVSMILVGGSVIICGKLLGKGTGEKMQEVFSMDLAWSLLIALILTAIFIPAALFDLTGILTSDTAVRDVFNRYLLGQAPGLFPLLAGNTLAAFLSMENRAKRTYAASFIYIVSNVALNFLFVARLGMGAFGLALASSLGAWGFLLVQAVAFLKKGSVLRLSFRKGSASLGRDIFRVGLPGAASNVYQSARGLIVNRLIEAFVGSIGISAFAASDTLMRIFWALPVGMLAVSRMMISISAGEEDRRSLADIMRVMARRYLPIMCAVSALIVACAGPFAGIFYSDASSEVYVMTVWGFRILPLCMPLSVIYMHFACWYQVSGKSFPVHLLALLDGVVCVAGFTAMLIGRFGMNSVYIANVLNGVVTTLVIAAYSCIKNGRLPRGMEEMMVMEEGFGAPEERRLDISVDDMDEVLTVSRRLQQFCLERGVDERRSFLAALCMEEMAGNIVSHGFTKDEKKHSIEIRAVIKDDDVILRIRDDCVPFDPYERSRIFDGDDVLKNIGIRLVYKAATEVTYNNILGLNVLTVRLREPPAK